MTNVKNTPVYLVCGDIYLRFPEIMKEELDDLVEFLDDEHIVYEGATKKFKDLQQRIEKATAKLDSFISCCKCEKLESGSDYLHHQYWDMFENFNKQVKEILKGENNE